MTFTPSHPASPTTPHTRTHASTTTSLKLIEADPPPGAWAATANASSKAPSIREIRHGEVGYVGWDEERQRDEQQRSGPLVMMHGTDGEHGAAWTGSARRSSAASLGRGKRGSRTGSAGGVEAVPLVADEESERSSREHADHASSPSSSSTAPPIKTPSTTVETPKAPSNGYTPPPRLPWTTSTVIALKSFSRWVLTPTGFFITLYGLNVVAWGGMLFLLLCNAAPAMCYVNIPSSTPGAPPTRIHSCNHIDSPRRKWVEITSQIVNALFCVTGFGLIPWRFRDLWWLLVWRVRGRTEGIRRLAGIHRGWFRLPGSDRVGAEGEEGEMVPDEANPALPLPVGKRPDAPLTGVRAPPTKAWKMDFVVWCNVWNTFLQACLCGFMWGMTRYNRPAWATGLFVALACGVAGAGGIMMYVEGKHVKKVEGVPPKVEQTVKDVEKGVEMKGLRRG